MRKKPKATMMYKTLNGIGPESLTVERPLYKYKEVSQPLYTYKNEITNYKLRSISSGLYLPQPRTDSMKNSFMYDGAKLWNSISNEIRE
jgi:hypothetical protein